MMTFSKIIGICTVLIITLTISFNAGTPLVTDGESIQGAGCNCSGTSQMRCDAVFTQASCSGQSDRKSRCLTTGASTSGCRKTDTFDCGSHCGTMDVQQCDSCC